MSSPKAFVVSNIAHWVFFVTGWLFLFALYFAGATISSDGTESAAAIFAEMKSSTGLLAATELIFFLAPVPAGYIGAKIAPNEKLLNGALSVSVWLVFALCDAIWGSSARDGNEVHLPHWLDSLMTYGVAIPAMFGAYIWHVRADRLALATTNVRQHHDVADSLQRATAAPPIAVSKQNQKRRLGRAGSGLGLFIFLLMQILLTRHEQNVVLIALISVVVLIAAATFIVKALRGTSG